MDLISDLNSNQKILSLKAAAMHIPLAGAFELIPTCNMNCKMCYIRISKEQMDKQGKLLTVQQWIDIAEQAKNAGLLYLLITGGEPLTYPGFEELYSEVCQMGIVPALNTNGTLLNEHFADVLAKNRPQKVNISLYGASDETYRKLCGNPKGLTQVLQGIRLLKERGIPVKLNSSMTSYNYEDLERMKDISEKLDVPLKIANYMFPPNRQQGRNAVQKARLSPEKAAEYSVENMLYKKSKEEKISYVKELLEQYHEFYQNPILLKESGFTCYACKNNFWINWKGEMIPCGMIGEQRQSVLGEGGFLRAWNDISQEVSCWHANTECVSCPKRKFCQYCLAAAYTETGDVSKKPEYLCQLAEATLHKLETVYKELTA